MKKSLKWLMMLLCIITPAIFASCGGDDDKDEDIDNGGDDKKELVGTWSDDETDDWEYEGGEAHGYIFKSNGRYIYYGYGREREEGKYKVNGNEVTFYADEYPDDPEIYRFQINSNILILTEYEAVDDDYNSPDYYYRVK